MRIELYIDRQLCDISDPDKLAVYLKRQLYNPAEVNTKDAQASYTITLPASTTNNRIFGFVNVEEIRGKFERLYDAELIVNGIRIFEGNFKLSEINSYSYKGNLGIPAPKTAKDIFGDKNMNKMDKWVLDFTKTIEGYEQKGGLSFIDYYNKKADSPCIFPFVLYGLLPKVPQPDGDYSAKDVLDDTVRFGIEDFPPSVNCLQMLKQLFANAGYELGGSVFQDERLKKLYVSYKNPNDYVQEWNWGDLSSIKIDARWQTETLVGTTHYFERQIQETRHEKGGYFSVNLFDSNFLEVKDIKDSGSNVIYSKQVEKYAQNEKINYERKNVHVIIPQSGYYKISLECHELILDDSGDDRWIDPITNMKFTRANGGWVERRNNFERSRYEIQVMRDYGEGDFHNGNIVGLFHQPQFPQVYEDEGVPSGERQHPKYYPTPGGPMVIDPSVNPNFVCGLHWGEHGDNQESNPLTNNGISENFNLKLSEQSRYAYYMFIANGFSWDLTFSQKKKILCAYDSSAYDADNNRLEGNYWYYGTDENSIEEIVSGSEPQNAGQNSGTIEPKTKLNPQWDYKKPHKMRYATFEDYSRTIENGKITSNNAWAEKGNPLPEELTWKRGGGKVECAIWLEKGERLAVCVTGDMGDRHNKGADQWVVLMPNVDFTLQVEPYRSEIEWNNLDSKGSSNLTKKLNWNDPVTFKKGSINLIDFLPSAQKVDEWIQNFCKAFNLSLEQRDGNTFELNVKQREMVRGTHRIIDLDARSHVVRRSNLPLGLPYMYKLGFSVNTDEEGYVQKIKDGKLNSGETGGGDFYTGSHETDTVEQTSNFSYCWYKDITDETKDGEILRLPVISDKEVWNRTINDYADMVKKQYLDKGQRFWYPSGNTKSVVIGIDSDNTSENEENKPKKVEVALVSNTMPAPSGMKLDYKDEPDSIMRNYFFLLDNNSHYTEIECLLMPDEYRDIDTGLAKLNGDLYHIVTVDGYDPACRKPAKLRLIPKLN